MGAMRGATRLGHSPRGSWLLRPACGIAVACAAVSVAPDALAQATLLNGFGGPAGYGATCVPACDDCSWPQTGTGLALTTAFPNGLHFYSGTYRTVYVNNNGNISFASPLATFTPNAFPGAAQPMIAPFWADVDTRDPSSGCATATTCSSPTTNGVWYSLQPGRFIVTWDHVGYYNCHPTPVMSFQLVLSSTPCSSTSALDFDIEFRYAQCGWEVGQASGGLDDGFCPDAGTATCTPAQAGFDSAETPDLDYWSIPGSRTNGIAASLCAGSNLNPPQAGIWRFAVRGGAIMCPTAGTACTTSMPGICAQGKVQCGIDAGSTTCVSVTGPQPKACNGLDNDCDGVIDNGPCPGGTACDGHACVPACIEGGCPSGSVCSNGLCVERACLNVTCDAGLQCMAGTCSDPCTGVVCPLGQSCHAGTCLDPCAALNCGMGQVCVDGVCKPSCPCTQCASTESCATSGTESGHCLETACINVTCAAGQACKGGTCVDACAGAKCPAGQHCTAGACVAVADAGTDAGKGFMLPEAGMPSSSMGEGGVDATIEGDASTEAGPSSNTSAWGTSKKSGCGCTTGGGDGGFAGGVLLGVAYLLRRGRTSRRKRQPTLLR
jgi:hypothetical protein